MQVKQLRLQEANGAKAAMGHKEELLNAQTTHSVSETGFACHPCFQMQARDWGPEQHAQACRCSVVSLVLRESTSWQPGKDKACPKA